jgi:hypothetical protein
VTETRITGLIFIAQLAVLIAAASILLAVSGRAASYGVAVTSTYPDNLHGVAKLGNAWGLIVGGAVRTAFVLMAIGFARLTTAIHAAGSRVLAIGAILLFALGAAVYIFWATFEIGPTVWAAEHAAQPTVLAAYEPLYRWEGILFATFMLLFYVSIAVAGLALARTHIVPAWAGWGSLVFGLLGTTARVIDPELPAVPMWILAGVPGWIPLWGLMVGIVLFAKR